MALMDRVMGAAQLKADTYEELEHDTDATSQAMTVVVAVAVLTGIGGLISAAMNNNIGAGIGALIGGIIMSILGWFLASYVMYWVGTTLFGGTATWGEVLRTLGFAYAPSALNVLSFIPGLGGIIGLIAGIWTLIAQFIAIRQALDISTGKTIGTIIVGLIVYIIIFAIIGGILAALGFGAAVATGALGR